MTYQPRDRRPIRARDQRFWQAAAAVLARLGVSANTISLIGMLAGLTAGALFLPPDLGPLDLTPLSLALAAVLVFVRLLANMFDGMVAVATGTASPVGELYNEIPDRISDTAILVGAGYATGSSPTLGFVAALAAMLTAYVRAVGKVAGAPQEYRGPMAKQQRMFTLIACALFLALTPSEWHPTFEYDAHTYGLLAAALAVIVLGSVVTVIRRLASASKHLRARP